jgi:hypothetical protein
MALRRRIRAVVIAIWPSLPQWVGRHYWLGRVLQMVGLTATPPSRPSPKLPAKFEEMAKLYRRGNIPAFVTGKLEQLQDRNVARTMLPFLKHIHPTGDADEAEIMARISAFRDIYLSSPIPNNHGGANYTTGLALFLITREFDPEIMIESGVWRGMSSMLFRAAAPRARILAFDISLGQLEFRSQNVEYRECDWMSDDIRANGPALAYFDDHINQTKRLLEAHQRGFKHLIFDDSWSWGAVSADGLPPVPTIDMIMGNELKVGEKVEWVNGDKLWTYTHAEEMDELCNTAKKLIKLAVDIPSLFRETGIAPTSALKFVTLT